MTPMFYIHQAYCISAQQTFLQADIETLLDPVEKKMKAIEPAYEGIPPGTLRRMGKAVRIGVGAAMPIIKNTDAINGIIIGTCNGGMEDCIKFLNQIIQYEEGLLAPGNFVQSTVNAVASQIGLFSHNRSYNITHVHRGLSFENSIIDAAMQLAENKEHNYLLGAVDEISDYNYNIDLLGHWYKNEDITASALYDADSPGCVAGEGSAMFMVNNISQNAIAKIQAIATLHSEEEEAVNDMLNGFIHKNFAAGERPDLLLSGENGDNRFLKYYRSCESITGKDTAIARFKHMTGEFTTATGPALWLACQILKDQHIPGHMVKVNEGEKEIRSILIYNNHKGYQHSCILVSLP
jgi:3-oxoacyl-(acyl-carrier-protein) synthase